MLRVYLECMHACVGGIQRPSQECDGNREDKTWQLVKRCSTHIQVTLFTQYTLFYIFYCLADVPFIAARRYLTNQSSLLFVEGPFSFCLSFIHAFIQSIINQHRIPGTPALVIIQATHMISFLCHFDSRAT